MGPWRTRGRAPAPSPVGLEDGGCVMAASEVDAGLGSNWLVDASDGAAGWTVDDGPDRFLLDEEGFSCTRVCDAPEVWRVKLLMRETFLPSVNAFVVRDAGETLVVDTGTPDPLNDTRLMRALLRLGVDPARTTVFCTHAHNDHTGLALELSLAGAEVLVGSGTLDDMRRFAIPPYRDFMAARLAGEGTDLAEGVELADTIWSHTLNLEAMGVPVRAVEPGSVVRCGRWEFEVVAAPGHTPGLCVLWLPSRRIAFLGDSVLFLCSTCLCFWDGTEDPIGLQLGSLERVANLGVEVAFMGHGLQRGSVADRCRANAAHHERRSARALEAIRCEPGHTGFELIGSMGWRAPGTWEQTPAITRWFLASESVAHLDHLVALGLARREFDERGISRYYPA